MHRSALFLILSLLLLNTCKKQNPNFQTDAANPEFLHRTVTALTDIIIHDIFSPPVASRIYAYSSIAAYECLAAGEPALKSLAGQLTGLAAIPAPEEGQEYCFPLAAVTAQLRVGKALIFSEQTMEEHAASLYASIDSLGIPDDVYKRSVAYGERVAEHIMGWAAKDNYKETRTAPKFSLDINNPGRWQPTPPAYMDGVEPNWRQIRPFVLDSAGQFKPNPPTPFSSDKNSRFYTEAMEVYEASKEADGSEKTAIAAFWDCNPYVSHQQGHVMFATKKITPGGHWMGIAAVACRSSNASMAKAAEAYAMTAVSLMDGFISCWDEKYRSNLIRPETYINRYIDPEWRPMLQTPPFPEYTSGHSVISRAAAVVLTHLFGENFAYVDTVEIPYGLPARSYKGFLQASEEAAISRLYGGIHYRPAISEGSLQGERVGRHVLSRVETREGMLGER